MPTFTRKSDLPMEHNFSGIRVIGWQVGIHSYAWSPPTDIYEIESAFIVRLEVAGMRESDFSISVENNYMVVRGIRNEVPERRAYHQMEIRFGEFSTVIELTTGVDVTKIEADYEDGFLTVILPKTESTNIFVKD